MQAISPERLSELIGRIYDCAIEPDLWPQTMQAICEDLRCVLGAILLVDLKHSRHRVMTHCNAEEFARRSIGDHAEEITAIYRSAPDVMRNSLDEPLVLSRDVPEAIYRSMPYYRDLVMPMGLCDFVAGDCAARAPIASACLRQTATRVSASSPTARSPSRACSHRIFAAPSPSATSWA